MQNKEAIQIYNSLMEVAKGLIGMHEQLKERVCYLEQEMAKKITAQPTDYSREVLQNQKILILQGKRIDSYEDRLIKMKEEMIRIAENLTLLLKKEPEQKIECEDEVEFHLNKNEIAAEKQKPVEEKTNSEELDKQIKDLSKEVSDLIKQKTVENK